MSSAPAVAQPVSQRVHRVAGLHNRVLLTLMLAALAAAFGLAFVTVAPNRLVTGSGVSLPALLVGSRAWLWSPAALLFVAAWLPSSRVVHGVVVASAALWLAGLLWLAGNEAAVQSARLSSLARVSFGGAFWIIGVLVWLAAADAVQRLQLTLPLRALVHAGVLLPLLALLLSGALDQTSLLKEFANRQDVFRGAALRHFQIVLLTLAPALLIGVPLGIAAARHARLGRPLLAVLGVIQTVPSIALFGLLMAPLAALALALPGWGLSGIGLLPAVLALTLYSLLPIVHGTAAGLRQVPRAVIDAATGMGLTPSQLFWRVEVPLALPVLLSGLRITTVQLIGLAVVAALIGAGGFGALVFQGLLSSALDLVLLGVLPVVALALAVDAGLGLLSLRLARTAP